MIHVSSNEELTAETSQPRPPGSRGQYMIKIDLIKGI